MNMCQFKFIFVICFLPVVRGHIITWSVGLGNAVVSGQSLSVTTSEVVELDWTSGHNVYRTTGRCDDYPSVASYMGASDYTVIEASHPGQQSYSLPVPQIQSSTSYCYACISHYSTMQFTLGVSPSVNGIVCIDESVKVLSPKGFVRLSEVVIGQQLTTPTGQTTVNALTSSVSDDRTWKIIAGNCNATVDTIFSPSHAVLCNDKWSSVREAGTQSPGKQQIRYVNVHTSDYCHDKLILNTGIIVETWDGRSHAMPRPHYYENGKRMNCIDKNK